MAVEGLEDATVSIPEHVLFQEIGEEVALLHLDTEIYFGLDAVGAEMWRALERTGSLAGAHAELLATFDVAPDRLATDLTALVEQLAAHQLLQIERQPG